MRLVESNIKGKEIKRIIKSDLFKLFTINFIKMKITFKIFLYKWKKIRINKKEKILIEERISSYSHEILTIFFVIPFEMI